MARFDVNRFGEMEVFVRAVELGGFSPAARASGMTPSAVSKLVARMERRLGTRLLNRSTRQFQLTGEGCVFFERARRILADLEEAERAAGAQDLPAGRVRVNTSASYAAHILAPLLPGFLERYPGIALEVVQTDAVVDLLAERADVAIRAGPLKSSTLVARKLGETRLRIVASPGYLARRGTPRSLADLAGHDRLGLGYARASDGWALRENGASVVLPAAIRVQAGDGEGLRHLALAGAGLARLSGFTVRADIAAGRLVPVLGDLDAGEHEVFHAVHAGGGPLPARVRALLDTLAEHGSVRDAPP